MCPASQTVGRGLRYRPKTCPASYYEGRRAHLQAGKPALTVREAAMRPRGAWWRRGGQQPGGAVGAAAGPGGLVHPRRHPKNKLSGGPVYSASGGARRQPHPRLNRCAFEGCFAHRCAVLPNRCAPVAVFAHGMARFTPLTTGPLAKGRSAGIRRTIFYQGPSMRLR